VDAGRRVWQGVAVRREWDLEDDLDAAVARLTVDR
jgi:hypothetical protein